MVKTRNRIKEHRTVNAGTLLHNPKNWRRHPQAQQDALQGAINELGFARSLTVYETPEGLMLIDGHLRADLDPKADVVVEILDVTPEEADKLLITLDPLAIMATQDTDKLQALLEAVSFENYAVMDMLNALGDNTLDALKAISDPPILPDVVGIDLGDNIELCVCECGHEHHRSKK